jgi:hypothetical protein
MARSLTVDNETHWRSRDVQRLVRGALDEVDLTKTGGVIRLGYSKNARAQVRVEFYGSDNSVLVKLKLPKRGTTKPHPSALVALATAGVPTDAPLVPAQDVFCVANTLAAELGMATGDDSWFDRLHSINPPAWGNDLFIAKYADPSKDAGYVSFVEKAEAKIEAAQARVDNWTEEKSRADKNLKRALRDLKAAQRSLKDAKKRRGL